MAPWPWPCGSAPLACCVHGPARARLGSARTPVCWRCLPFLLALAAGVGCATGGGFPLPGEAAAADALHAHSGTPAALLSYRRAAGCAVACHPMVRGSRLTAVGGKRRCNPRFSGSAEQQQGVPICRRFSQLACVSACMLVPTACAPQRACLPRAPLAGLCSAHPPPAADQCTAAPAPQVSVWLPAGQVHAVGRNPGRNWGGTLSVCRVLRR